MAIASVNEAKKEAAKLPVLAVIYDSTIEPKAKRLGSRAGLTNSKPIIRPDIVLMGKPRSTGTEEGMSKECPLLPLRFGANILENRELWEEVKLQPYVAKLLNNGQLSEVEATKDEEATFSSFSVEDTEVLLANLYHQDFVDSYLAGENRKEVFKMAEERKAEIIRIQEARK